MTTDLRSEPGTTEPPGDPKKPRSPLPPLIAGVVLVVVGLVAVGYGFFNGVLTNVFAARAQERLAVDLDERIATVDPIANRSEYLEQLAQIENLIGEDPTLASPSGSFDNPDDIPVMINQGDPSGLDPLVPDIDLPWIYETPPLQGEALGRIVIPQAEVDWVVVRGVSVEDLKQGPGHMPNTAVPGQLGNAVISGHRTTYGAPFFNLERLVPGDRFTVETVIGTHTYEVIESRIVLPTEVWVTSQWEGSWLTLTTCNPRYSSTERLIVFSKLVDGPNAESIEAQFDGEYVVPDPPTD